ncbi:hypothetical protein B0H14DRAFT_2584802 [Mycena olivaceomarginata]|nr:hypothetical protein B0H14DRAFT_2584802 [Mycena olivaceomarginata]
MAKDLPPRQNAFTSQSPFLAASDVQSPPYTPYTTPGTIPPPPITENLPPRLSEPSSTTSRRRASFSGSEAPLYSNFWTNLNRTGPGLPFRPTPSNFTTPRPPSSEPFIVPHPPGQSTPSRPAIPHADPFLMPEIHSRPSYNTFFSSLRPSVPPPKPDSYGSFFDRLQSNSLTPSSDTSSDDKSLPPPYSSTPAPNRSFGTNATNLDFSKFGQFTTSEDFTMGFESPVRSQSPILIKRKKDSDPDLPSNTERKRRREMEHENAGLSVEEKLHKVFDLIQSFGWASANSCIIPLCTKMFIARSGMGTFPDGAGADIESEVYSLTTPYTELAHVRSVLTSFAAQIVEEKLIKDARIAVLKSGGLHAPITGKKRSPHPTDGDTDPTVGFAELGASLMTNMKHILEQNQGLLYQYMVALASPDTPSRHGVVAPRRNRPPELAAINAVSMITFSRNYYARLLPLSHGILYLASHVPIDIIDINCRIGTMPSLETIKSALRGFSDQKAAKIRLMGRDNTVIMRDDRQMVKANVLNFDNSQYFRRQRERRIGRENMMVIGISATLFRMFVDLAACDPLDRRRRIALNLRANVTVEMLLGMIDFTHLRDIGWLQFLSSLATYIPELEFLKSEINLRYRTKCRKQQLPVDNSEIHPLACSGKNEAIIPELKDALWDFQNQFGQRDTDFDSKLWFAGGDGMSYNNMLLVQKYMQNHTESPFQSFQLMVPVLQVWHTMWTDLCRIHETHWGSPLNDDPATLGNSAKKIGRPAPGNLSKVDYYPAAELVSFKCDDLHRTQKNLPSFEDLETIAKRLFDTYSSMTAQTEALSDARDGSSAWADKVPLGTPWVPIPIDDTSAAPAPTKGKRKSKKAAGLKTTLSSPAVFHGDHVMSDSASFMRDASLSREAAAAVAEGDVGRVWEVMKAMLITFAGSGHSRYMGYLLEMVCNIELESGPELAVATLASLLCNPSIKPGGFQACDIFQERMNLVLEPVLQRKDNDYGSDHVRNMWSRNLKDIYDIKAEMRQSVGLAKRSGRHKAPHQKPEVKMLLRHYKDTELNSRRPGRTFGQEREEDNFTAGIKKLRGGSLSKWVRKTTRERAVHLSVPPTSLADEDSDSDESDDDDSEVPQMTLGLIHAFDGEVVVDLGLGGTEMDMHDDSE